ncbi:peptidase T [soil metagenome]
MNHSALDRFLRYVTFDTRADESSSSTPSTPGQLVLARHLVEELRGMGIADAAVDAHGYVTATIPATADGDVPVIGFIAHVDTSPEMDGANVKPLVREQYDGRDLVLPDDPSAVLRTADDPALAARLGDTIVTASGLTLLGADDKAGVAAIMAAAEHLMAHKEIPHGMIRIAFTPDEEIGRGANHFDVAAFGAVAAYTLDGGSRGELEYESFAADAVTVTFRGFNTHPGYAKGRMINAIKLAAEFVTRLPRHGLSPETTDGREGYVHPYQVQASVDRTSVKVLLRDFTATGLREQQELVERLAHEVVASHPASPGAGWDAQPGTPVAAVEFTVEESYRNMREVLDHHPQVVEFAREAMQRAGIEPVERPIRGGTDGSRLSFMGLPTPNLFAGEHNFHSRLEWVSAEDMDKAVEVIVHLAQIWAEPR